MHDFIRFQSFSVCRVPVALRPSAADWIQRGIMRSFGEDDVVAPYRSSPLPVARPRRRLRSAAPFKSRI